ncbi:cytochrome o ubiquinol oxidase subunit III [Candidatus Blochmanniella floridana]|uniref:Cytochrome bo(3) ubiquinol oxidase subunit 3 n=1 Tax=Blochmanniella floridana TaxID=203907 RepID=Q7VRH4_BLOFL|nr:cytochrome o ubiquinol oxidase subunit III [Candidatus Blochmannia floridanus]
MHTINKNIKLNTNNTTIFGFWLYIMSDCILFASLFAMHAVLSTNFQKDLLISNNIFKLTFVFTETILLLLSSITCSTSMIYANITNPKKTLQWMILTLLLGLGFISMEIYEFHHLIANKYNPSRNAFFSSFFVLIGTHGIHVITGLIWIIIMTIHLIMTGLTQQNLIRLHCFSLFWHFLDIIWICVFTEVYLIGVL